MSPRWSARLYSDTVVPQRLDLLPHGTVRLIYRWPVNGPPEIYAVGPRTSATYKTATALRAGLAVELLPGTGLAILGVPVRQVIDRVLPLSAFWLASDVERLVERLATAETDAARAAILEHALANKMARASRTVRRVLHRICPLLAQAERGDESPGAAQPTGTGSARSLRRDFSAAVGLSPKRYARIARFRRAAALVAKGDVALTAIALNLGYFDQAHLSADFREFARLSATRFRQGTERDRLAHSCHHGAAMAARSSNLDRQSEVNDLSPGQ